jgi:hypothetical protein
MKTLIALTLAGLFACGSAFAADTKMTPQQEKMKACNAEATGKTGDERKAFMKTCLSPTPPKMQTNNAMSNNNTAGMKAEERAKAQSECMKG